MIEQAIAGNTDESLGFRPVPFKFQLSDWTLLSVTLQMQMRAERLIYETSPVETPVSTS